MHDWDGAGRAYVYRRGRQIGGIGMGGMRFCVGRIRVVEFGVIVVVLARSVGVVFI